MEGIGASVETSQTVNDTDFIRKFLEIRNAGRENITVAQLTSDDAQMRFVRIWDYFRQELDRQSENRIQQQIDADYYDGMQWTAEEVAILEERGQVPRVYNKIKPTVDWVLGTEKRTKVDWKILPRTEDDYDTSQAKTDLMKYVSDANRLGFRRSDAFEDCVKVGIGWLETGVANMDDDEPLYVLAESWRNMLWDSIGKQKDLKDCRYIFRQKWLDVDVACAMFPNRTEAIIQSALSGDDYSNMMFDSDEAMDSNEFTRQGFSYAGSQPLNRRQRVRVVEGWYKLPVKVKKIDAEGHALDGQVYDQSNRAHRDLIRQGKKDSSASLTDRMMMQMRVCFMVSKGFLYDAPSPYKHNRFPFVPIWGYRRDRDGLPYGIIRPVRDPQDDLNKRISKALAIMSTNKVVMDKGAVDDLDELAREAGRPDGIIVKNPGKALELNADRGLEQPHLQFVDMDSRMIQDVGGVTDENLGKTTNATSGRAILARQDQGSLLTVKLFDNLRLAFQMTGEIVLSLMEQFYDAKKVIRLTDQRGNLRWRTLNDGMPENDIAASKADFVVSEQDFRDSIRQAQTEQLFEMIGRMPPEMAFQLLDMAVEMTDIPNKEEFVKRIRKINGQTDPDSRMSPEEQAEKQAADQAAAAQQELAMRAQNAAIAKDEASAAKDMATAQKTEAEAAQVGLPQGDPDAAIEAQANAEAESERASQLEAENAILRARLADKASTTAISGEIELAKAGIAAAAQIRVAEIGAAAKSSPVTDAELGELDKLKDQATTTGQQAVAK